MGRPPIGPRAMTGAERVQRRRARLRGNASTSPDHGDLELARQRAGMPPSSVTSRWEPASPAATATGTPSPRPPAAPQALVAQVGTGKRPSWSARRIGRAGSCTRSRRSTARA